LFSAPVTVIIVIASL